MKEICKICGCEDTKIIYNGPIKTGLLSGYTDKNYNVFQCVNCKTIWNHAQEQLDSTFYESAEYRSRIEDKCPENVVNQGKYDKNVLDKFNITGTDVFRNKVVADIGCGEGSFLDFISNVATEIIAIEPQETFHKCLKERGFHAFQYASQALAEWKGQCDLITSFDVIEHVDSPQEFAKEMYELCRDGGTIVCGTPTDYPVLRLMLGDSFNRFIFQVQHPWILSEDSLSLIFEKAGFVDVKIEKVQKYGLGNLLAWLNEGLPKGDIQYDFISDTLNKTYKQEMARYFPEYLVVKARKGDAIC